jgi:hypothetical protein
MTAQTKLTPGQKHILTLIRKDAGADGWAPVSKPVAQFFTNKSIPGGVMPPELCEFEPVGDDGRGRVRLTLEGRSLLDALAWL